MAKPSFATLHELKAFIAQKENHLLRQGYSCSSLPFLIPQGALVEIAGTSKVEWLISFLGENPSLKTFWTEPEFSLLPTALYQRGLNMDQMLFVEAGSQVFSVVRKVLRSQVFPCVVTPSIFQDEKTLKALQLLAEKSNATVFLLAQALSSAWPISLQFEVHRSLSHPGFEIFLKRNKTKIAAVRA